MHAQGRGGGAYRLNPPRLGIYLGGIQNALTLTCSNDELLMTYV